MAVDLQEQFPVSERRACAVPEPPRSTQRYQGRPRSDEAALCRRWREIVRRRPRFGYRRLTAVLRREGWVVNRKRVHRPCRKEGLKVRRTPRRTRVLGSSTDASHPRQATRKDHVWCWDFAFDRTERGTTLKRLSIVDEFTRECLALKVARSITSEDVLDTLAELFAMRGVPGAIRSDKAMTSIAIGISHPSGSEMTTSSRLIDKCCDWPIRHHRFFLTHSESS
jgi:putative transposase